MAGIWGDGQRGGIFGARVDPRLLAKQRIAEAFAAADGMQEPSRALYEAKHRRAQEGQLQEPGFWSDLASLGPRAVGGAQKMWQAVPMAAEALYNDPLGSINRAGLAGQAATDAIVQGAVRPFTQFGDPNVDPVENAFDLASVAGAGGLATAGAKPAGSLGTFGGRLAKTADLGALKRAEELKAAGASRDAIWQETGWDLDAVGGKPQFEISDDKSRFGPPRSENAPLGEVLAHPDLYAAYPELENIPTHLGPPSRTHHGSFSGSVAEGDAVIGYGGGRDHRSTLLHEGAGHGVQDIEGFPRGANQFGLRPNTPAWDIYQERLKAIRTPMPRAEFDARYADPQSLYTYEKYLKEHKAGLRKNAQMLDRAAQETAVQLAYERSAGEVASRNIQRRADMTAEERRVTPPWKTQDVPDEQQIVRFRSGGGAQESRRLKQETPFSGIKRDVPIEKTTATYAKGQKLLPEKPFDITQVPEGSHFVSTFGDRSDIGKRLTGIGGEKFQEPVDLYGGAGFMRRANNPDEAGWASGKSVITKLQNAVRPLQETGKPVYLIHTGMGQRAVDFSSMMIKTLEQQIKNKPLSKAAVKAFDKRMKAQWGKGHPALPDWPGWDNVDINNLSSPERLKAVKLMDTDDMRKLGFPDVGAARWAITDPKQRNSPFAGTGASIFELGGSIEHNVNPRVGHPDYPSQATSPGGKYVGTLPEIIHGLEFFVDVKKGLKPGTTNEAHIGRKFLMSPAIQRVSPEWLQHIINHLKSDRGQKLGIAGAIGAGLLTAEQAQEMFGADGGEEPGKT